MDDKLMYKSLMIYKITPSVIKTATLNQINKQFICSRGGIQVQLWLKRILSEFLLLNRSYPYTSVTNIQWYGNRSKESASQRRLLKQSYCKIDLCYLY